MSEKRRALLCLLSVLLACGVTTLSGAWGPATKLLHRWADGVFVVFLIVFVPSMFLIVRKGLSKSLLAIPVSAVLGYVAAIVAYIAYFAVFEPQLIANSVSQSQILDSIIVLLLVWPTASFAWMFGAITGGLFLVLGRALPQ